MTRDSLSQGADKSTQAGIKLAYCMLFPALQIVHRACNSGPRTVRPAHQITMAGDKVLSGDCRFARRNYFPDARKEIVARVTMARHRRRRFLAMETRNEFLHGTFLPLSPLPSPLPLPPSFSPAFPPAPSILQACFSAVSSPDRHHHSDFSSMPFRSETVLVSSSGQVSASEF